MAANKRQPEVHYLVPSRTPPRYQPLAIPNHQLQMRTLNLRLGLKICSPHQELHMYVAAPDAKDQALKHVDLSISLIRTTPHIKQPIAWTGAKKFGTESFGSVPTTC
jgi:hypothetical protein